MSEEIIDVGVFDPAAHAGLFAVEVDGHLVDFRLILEVDDFFWSLYDENGVSIASFSDQWMRFEKVIGQSGLSFRVGPIPIVEAIAKEWAIRHPNLTRRDYTKKIGESFNG